MFISSSRLRRVDSPDAPASGGVPPVDPPAAAPAAATPAPAATAPAAPTAPAKPLSKGLLIGIIGGAALVVIAIIAIAAMVLPAIFGGGATDKAEVTDIGAEPETTWEYDWVGDNDEDFLESSPNVASVGADSALVWATFDYYSFQDEQGGDAGWYEGYDEQYADGYAAGEEYLAAYEAWWDSDDWFTTEGPDEETYFPEDAYGNYDEWLGFQDGFYDAYYESGEGYSQKQKPVDPDYTPSIALINATNGDELWSVDLSDEIDGVDYQSSIQAQDIEGSNAVMVYVTTPDNGDVVNTAVTLDKGNGKVLSTLEGEGAITGVALGGDLIISLSDADGEETTIGRYGVNALDDDAKWEADMDGAARIVVVGNYVMVYNDDDDFMVLDGTTGKEAEWGDDLDTDVYYSFLGTQLLRFEDDEVEGYNTAGKSVWEDSVKSEMNPWFGDGVLLVADEDGDQFTDLQRINPSNGSEMWSEAFGDEFDYVIGVQGNSLLLAEGSKIIVVDLGSGKERFTQKAGDFYGVAEGTNMFYVSTSDELAAYRYGEKGDVWTLDLDENEAITRAGQHLVLIDYDGGTLHGLGS